MITFQKLQQVKDMFTQPFVYQIILSKENHKLTAIDLSKEQLLDAVPKAIQQINFFRTLASDPNAETMFFIIEEAEETIVDFS